MRTWRHLLFALSSAWQSFWRHVPVTAAGVLSITLIMILAGTCLLLGHAFSQVLDGYKQRVSVISISVADQTPMLTVEDFEDQLRQRPEVLSVRFVSKDEELRRFSEDPRNQQLIEQIQGNPVPAKIEVRVSRLADVKTIDTVARQWRGADRTDPTDYQGDFITNMLRLSTWLTVAGLGMLGVLTVASIVIVMNTIRTAVYHRRLEGVMTGLLAAALALGVLVLAYRPFVGRFQHELFFIPLTYDARYVGVLA